MVLLLLTIFSYYICNMRMDSLFFQASVIECSGHVDS